MGQTLEIIAGSDKSWSSTLYNAGVAVSYPGSATLSATVSRGGEEASLFAPSVAWVSSTAGTFTLSIAASQTASLDPGTYILQVFVENAGLNIPAFNGQLQVLPAVGTATPGLTWCSPEDLLLYSDAIKTLMAAKTIVDGTGFLGPRVQATSKRSRQIVLRYNPRPGYTLIRQNTGDSIVGMDVALSTNVPPSKNDVTSALNTVGGIVLEERLREMIARDAISLILRRAATASSSQTYRAEAEAQEAMAEDIFTRFQAQIITQTPVNGYTNFLIDRDAIILPTGTAP